MIERYWKPQVFSAPQYDGVYEKQCPYGVLESTDPLCGCAPCNEICSACEHNCSCSEPQIVGIGSPSCRTCHWCISYTSTEVTCDHPCNFPLK